MEEVKVIKDELTFSHYYEQLRVLGKGSFGTVVAAIEHQASEPVAVKVRSPRPQPPVDNSQGLSGQVRPGAPFLRNRDPQAVRPQERRQIQTRNSRTSPRLQMHETPSEIYIAMELMEGGQLEAVIKERRKQGKSSSAPHSPPEIGFSQ